MEGRLWLGVAPLSVATRDPEVDFKSKERRDQYLSESYFNIDAVAFFFGWSAFLPSTRRLRNVALPRRHIAS